MTRHRSHSSLSVALVAGLTLLTAGCGSGRHNPATTASSTTQAAAALPTSTVPFGTYDVVPLIGSNAPAYAGPATPHSLTGVKIVPAVQKLLKNPGVAEALAKNGFVVVPADIRLFQYAYEGNIYAGWPVFVTTDVAYHEWHQLYDKTLRDLEQDVLLPKLEKLVSGSIEAAHAQSLELAGTPLAGAASRVEQLFDVAAAELRQPVELGPLAQKEKALIDAHAANVASPLLGVKVDYSLFTPRGHYTRTPALTHFFLGMSVLGQLPFCLPGTVDCPGTEPVQIGMLAARTLVAHPELVSLWQAIYEPTAFLVGRSDDYTPLELAAAAKTVDPTWLKDPAPLAKDAQKVVAALVASRPVKINPDKAAVRYLGTRFVIDSYVLDQLVYPNVGTASKPRLLPSALDLAAVLGSDFAYQLEKKAGASGYANYDSQLAKLKQAVTARPAADWGGTVYDAWLYALQPLFVQHGKQFPDFMRTPLWTAKDLQTGLGSYAQLKHDTVLFAKQFVAEGGGETPPARLNWVEPDPVAFGRLAAAASLLRSGLAERKLLTPRAGALIRDEINLFAFFERIAKEELAAKPIAKADNDRLTYLGGELEALWFRTSDLPVQGPATADQTDAIVADLGSSPKGVLEVATGRTDRIYVLVPDGKGGFEVALGGVYSYYEFTSPPGVRLDDTAWRAELDKGTAPKRPAWEGTFLAGRPEAAPSTGA
ncbi:MAG TPA: DUF3160 domain-containing protein [Gaiellaceae bacterium]|nr:DUF3160 domain-containing protein [Gaiellaceae bacterium]